MQMQDGLYPHLILEQPLLLLFVHSGQLGEAVSGDLALDLVLNLREPCQLDDVAADILRILDELTLGLQPEHLIP